jgi:hypothetical protein
MFVSIGKTLAAQARIMAGAAAQAVAMGAMMKAHGVKSFANKFHELQFRAAARGHKTKYRRHYSSGAINGKRECQGRVLQNAHLLQVASHKRGTVQPRHIFGGVHGN